MTYLLQMTPLLKYVIVWRSLICFLAVIRDLCEQYIQELRHSKNVQICRTFKNNIRNWWTQHMDERYAYYIPVKETLSNLLDSDIWKKISVATVWNRRRCFAWHNWWTRLQVLSVLHRKSRMPEGHSIPGCFRNTYGDPDDLDPCLWWRSASTRQKHDRFPKDTVRQITRRSG